MIWFGILVFLLIRWLYLNLPARRAYKRSGYRDLTGVSYGPVMSTRDSYLRFVFYTQLRGLPDGGRILMNLELPEPMNASGRLDYVQITRQGIYLYHYLNTPVRIERDIEGIFWKNDLNNGHREPLSGTLAELNAKADSLIRYLGEDYTNKVFQYLILGDECQADRQSYQADTARIIRRFFFTQEMKSELHAELLSEIAANSLYAEMYGFRQPFSPLSPAPSAYSSSVQRNTTATSSRPEARQAGSPYLFPGYTGSGFQEARYSAYRHKTAEDKGAYGECLIYRDLQKIPYGHRILSNIYLPKENGTTTEIDLIQITPQGIFVYESKNISGWIYGSETQKVWTVVLAGGRSKHQLYNPIWQNQAHIEALNRYFKGAYEGRFHSYIIFSDHCELKDITLTSNAAVLTHRRDLAANIQYRNYPNVLTENDCNLIFETLGQFTHVNEDIKKRHNQAVSSWS